MIIYKEITVSLKHIIVFIIFNILIIILFTKKKTKEIYNLNNKIKYYKDKNNKLKKTNVFLLYKIKNMIPKIYNVSNLSCMGSLGNHNSSHSNPIQPAWL